MSSFVSRSPWTRRLRRAMLFLLLDGLVALIAWSWPVMADTSATLRSSPAACFCSCAESHARAGCPKMCELKKYASRWWATSCAKPHGSVHKDDSGSGPRFPHPGRTEHARVLSNANAS